MLAGDRAADRRHAKGSQPAGPGTFVPVAKFRSRWHVDVRRVVLEARLTVLNVALAASPTSAQWFEEPIQFIPVKRMGEFSQSADGACQVELPDGSVGYVKPRPDAAKNIVVAREKIASDLAYLLGIPVAPVVVRKPDAANGWLHHSALSLACLKGARLWGAGGDQYLALAGPSLEALRVFWTWIGDSDHNGHQQNLLFAIQSGKCDVMAIDHSFSMCHGNHTDPLAVGACQGYGTAGLAKCVAEGRSTVAKIGSLPSNEIERVVRRLQAILTVEEQDRILKIIEERRQHLAAILGLRE